MSKTNRLQRNLAFLLIALTPMSGCGVFVRRPLFREQIPANQAEAGSTHIAVLSVAPWEEYAKALQPNFTFDEAKALELAGATTQAFEEKVTDALSLMVKLSPPQTTSAETIRRTKNVTDAEGNAVPERSEDRTDTLAPGDTSLAPTLTTGTEADLPTFPAGVTSPLTKQLALEPMLKYAAATALLQEVRLLNRYVEDAVQRHDYQAYVVRLQVSVMPSARNEPIDAYTTASFFIGDDGSSAGVAVPLGLPRGPRAMSQNLQDINILMSATSDPSARSTQEISRKIINAAKGEDVENDCNDLFLQLNRSISNQNFPLYIDIASRVTSGKDLRTEVEALGNYKSLIERSSSDREKMENQHQFLASCTDTAQLLMKASSPGGDTPFVVPLLVTDDLELSSQARALNEARQFAFGLQVMAQGFGGSLGSTRLARKLQAVVGNDINSLMSLARVTDNTVRVRFGAMQQATAQYAMVPRTNNVTLLILVPKQAIVEDPNLGSFIDVLGRTEMINAKSGKPIPPAPLVNGTERCTEILTPYSDFTESDACDKSKVQELLNDVMANRYASFVSKVSSKLKDPKVEFPYKQLWLDFAAATTYSAYASTNFELPKLKLPQAFCEQSAALIDDGKSEATITLRDAKFLLPTILSATVQVREKDSTGACKTSATEHTLPASQIVVPAERSSATFKFPSPTSLGLDPSCAFELHVTCRGCVVPTGECARPPANPTMGVYILTGLKKNEAAPAARPARFTIVPASASLLQPINSNELTLRLLIKKEKATAAEYGFAFRIEGARVKQVVASSGANPTMVENLQTWQVISGIETETIDVILDVLSPRISVTAKERLPKISGGEFVDGPAATGFSIPVNSPSPARD